jgi:hypothetical protein
MRMKNLTSHAEHLDRAYGKRGAKRREEYEKGSQEFLRQVMLEIKKEENIKAKKRRLSSSHSTRTNSRP